MTDSCVESGIVFLNGSYIPQQEAKVSVLDRGFLFGDSIYEVIPVYQSFPFRLDEHLFRLHASLNAIKMAAPYSIEQWRNIITEVVKKNSGNNQSIYLQVTRGVPPRRDHAIPRDTSPTVLAMSTPLSTPSLNTIDNPFRLKAITTDDFRWNHCEIKSTSLIANVMLRQIAQDAGADEAILFRHGQLTEGAASNIFVVKDDIVFTPPKSQYLLGGITRDLLIEIMAQHEIECRQESVTADTISNADEIWATSSAREIAPVVSLNGKLVGAGEPGPIWRKVASLYITYKQRLCETGLSKINDETR